jgi:PIN domain nuclease of toxin-antitoxin system
MLLLDTQVVLWLVDDNPRLGARARDRITSAQQVHVSAASVWELNIKAMLGKVTIPGNLMTNLVDQGLVPLNITPEHAEATRDFPELTRHDPFDRLLVAQADRTGLTLLTGDTVLLDLDRNFILDARV